MSLENLKSILEVLRNVAEIVAFLVGAAWALYKVEEYRENKYKIQLDIDTHLYSLDSPRDAVYYTWENTDRGGKRTANSQLNTHAAEVLLKFSNKGNVRFKLYNARVTIRTMVDEVRFDENDGHLSLKTVFRSGNIVPPMLVQGRPIQETSFYYIEPGTEQIIHFLTLISKPRELIQVVAEFSLEQQRLFPEANRGKLGLYPHSAVRTYQVDTNGRLTG